LVKVPSYPDQTVVSTFELFINTSIDIDYMF